jgi:hypothetical protein
LSVQTFVVPPGDPAGLHAAAAQFGRLATEHAALRGSFRRSVSRALERWTGGFADRFRGAAGEVAIRFDPVSESAKGAERALSAYAASLEAAQHAVNAANVEAAKLAGLHLSPIDRQVAMGQLDQQASAAQSSVNRAAALCAAMLAEAEATLAAACHDAVSVRQLRADVERASAELKAADPVAWSRIFGADGSLLRDVVERLHVSLDLTAYDWWMEMAGKGGEAAAAWMKGLEAQQLAWLHEMMPWGQGAGAEEWDSAVHLWFQRVDAAETFGEQWVEQTRWLTIGSRIGKAVGGPIAVWGDILTIMDPPQAGAMGWVDRTVAGTNAAVVGADTVLSIGQLAGVEALAELSLGPVGAVVAVGTGLYLAGAYAYRHWAWFRDDIARPIGHAVVHAVTDVGHWARDAWDTVTSWF